jgi:hypothetical protein
MIPIAAIALVGACSLLGLSNDDIPAVRSVLLQYATPPTSADSLAASTIGAGPVTMYPIINSMEIPTRVSDSILRTLNPTPAVTDFDSAGPNCGGLTLFVATVGTPTIADSLAIASVGIRVAGFQQDSKRHDVLGDFPRSKLSAVLSAINQLAGDTNIVDADLELEGCPFLVRRSR